MLFEVEIMEKLKQLIESNYYEEAIAFLRANQEIADPIKNYNLGFIKYKQQELVDAVYYLEKAKFSGLFSEEVNSAMAVVKKDLGINYIEQDYSFFEQFMLSLNSLSLDLYLFFIGFILFVTLILFYKKKMTSAFIGTMICFSLGYFTYTINQNKLYINSNETVVYRGPSKIFEESQVIPKGIKVIVSKSFKKWSYIAYPHMYSGWVNEYKAKKL